FVIRASGGVGIGTNSPVLPLHVNGSERVTGVIRVGSEIGSTEPPSPPGVVVRRINSTVQNMNQVVARTDTLTLERDGTPAGMLIRYPANPGVTTINWMGVNNLGSVLGGTSPLNNPVIGGTRQLFTDGQHLAHVEISFGRTYNSGQHLTQVVLDRYDDGTTS